MVNFKLTSLKIQIQSTNFLRKITLFEENKSVGELEYLGIVQIKMFRQYIIDRSFRVSSKYA